MGLINARVVKRGRGVDLLCLHDGRCKQGSGPPLDRVYVAGRTSNTTEMEDATDKHLG